MTDIDSLHLIPKQQQRINKRQILIVSIACACVLIVLVALRLYVLTTPPKDMRNNTSLEITKGMNVKTIAEAAQDEHVVRSNLLLYAILTLTYDPTTIHAGTYVFPQPVSVFTVASKLAHSEVQNTLIKLTIPEGMRATQIAALASSQLKNFDTRAYITKTADLEGYLFPETYMVPKNFTAQQLIDIQRKTYEQRIAPLREQIKASGFSEYEVLTLASIIEREAKNKQSMRMVSGILQNRLKRGMPLQVDASLEYELDKPLGDLTSDDLQADSPYNTYTNSGLTPTPIGNPGLQSIDAVLNPIKTDYYYYITADDGTFYYAKTFQQHKANIQKYLK